MVSRLLIWMLLSFGLTGPAMALFVSEPKAPDPIIRSLFPNATSLSDKSGELKVRRISQGEQLLGYVFETNDIAPLPAYSGEPVNVLVAIDPQGQYLGARVLEHHEPIILAGIPEFKLDQFASQYQGLSVSDNIKIGKGGREDQKAIDGLSGATVTVMVMNVAITKAASKVAQSLGILAAADSAVAPKAAVNLEFFEAADWLTLTGNGAIRRLLLSEGTVDDAFIGTEAESVEKPAADERDHVFAELYYALADVPTIGRNLLGDSEYQYLMEQLQPGEHYLLVLGNGYSFKGSGYVRGGIFDRIQLHQGDTATAFRDLDHSRITDLYLPGTPHFSEMSVFRIGANVDFDPGSHWELELLVRRQIGAIDSTFASFKGGYELPESYLNRPVQAVAEPELSLTDEIWQDKRLEVYALVGLMLVLLGILFFQDLLVKHPTFLHRLRRGFLLVTVIFVGWVWGGQLSVVNVFTFLGALASEFHWELFLMDPVIFILWCGAAVTVLLWGRAVYCGWLCPFGALQELVNSFGRYIKLPQLELPYSVHERLWAIKYLILLGLFGLSLDSLALAEQFAEVEPFKTTFLLKFDREWPFVAWAVFLILISLFNRKTFCRYLCPLGAALSVGNGVRLFSWLKRRPECGDPCKTCAKECEIQAIAPDGVINMRECHYCLDCQMTYFNAEKCPPLKKLAYKQAKYKEAPIEARVVTD